ncbi:repressor of nif and glnA expression [Halarchaeum solikamskense]|nr:MarR family transcriptional regulator [Halarchaeum solikamskense]MBP2251635.1 repressor of nif and glnA expression [Halarchaeum solikamskense]
MSLADDRILEYIRENESGSPEKMRKEGPIHYSRTHIHTRCKTLTERGLLKHLGNGVYVLTDEGEAYLEGRLDTQNWQYVNDGSESANAGVEQPNGEAEGQEG